MFSHKPMILAVGLAVLAVLPARAAELLMVERPGCHWCERWHAEIAPAYPKTAEGARAPLRRAWIDDLPADLDLDGKPVFTPTFILLDDGRELGRIEGYPGEDFFWPLLVRLLDAHPEATVGGS